MRNRDSFVVCVFCWDGAPNGSYFRSSELAGFFEVFLRPLWPPCTRQDVVDIQLVHPSLSRVHFAIIHAPHQHTLYIMDMGSANKTLVNEQPLPPKEITKLSVGDSIIPGFDGNRSLYHRFISVTHTFDACERLLVEESHRVCCAPHYLCIALLLHRTPVHRRHACYTKANFVHMRVKGAKYACRQPDTTYQFRTVQPHDHDCLLSFVVHTRAR